jgi:hypothetical protein
MWFPRVELNDLCAMQKAHAKSTGKSQSQTDHMKASHQAQFNPATVIHPAPRE